MKNQILLFTFLAAVTVLNSQQVVLVEDYNEGMEDGYDNWNNRSHNYNGDYLLPLYNEEHGLELGILKNGQLSLMKEFVPGELGGEPRSFFTYKGKVYFSAKDENGDYGLWETNGTETGTVVAMDPGYTSSSPVSSYLISDSGWLYYAYSGEQWRTDGTAHEKLGEKEYFGFGNTVTNGISKYKGEVAFIVEETSMVSISQILPDGTYEQLMEMETSFGTDVESFIILGDYFLFELDEPSSSGTLDGFYYWKEGQAAPEKLDMPRPPSRFIKLSDNTTLATLFQDGVYSITADPDLTFQEEFDGWPETYVQGAAIKSIVHKGKALYIGHDNWPDNGMFITDVNTMETEVAFLVESYPSDFHLHNNYAFIATGTSNGFEPIIQYFDFKNLEDGIAHAFSERSLQSGSVIMVGVQEGKLYFLSNLFPDTGRELYSLDVSGLTDLDVGVEDSFVGEIDLDIFPNGFRLNDEFTDVCQAQLLDMSGKMVQTFSVQTGEIYNYDVIPSIYVLRMLIGNKEYNKTVLINP